VNGTIIVVIVYDVTWQIMPLMPILPGHPALVGIGRRQLAEGIGS